MDARIKNTINEGILKLIIDVSSLEEVEEDAIEVVGEFAEKEDMKLPMRGAIIATGEDAEMWNNLMVAKNGVSVRISIQPRIIWLENRF